MIINQETARQFLDSLNDYIGGGDLVIDAISPSEWKYLDRKSMDELLIELMKEVVKLK